MSTSTAVDITDLALSVELADTMLTIDEKDLALFVNDDAGRRVSRGGKLG
jgi:hypothetical protein